jgi:hypothetical protein
MSDHTLQQILRVVKKVQWEPAVTERMRPSVLKMFTSQSHKLCTSNLSDLNCENSEDSLSSVALGGSKENIINSVKCNDTETDLGSKRFWTSLRINLPPKRPTDVKTNSLNF